MVIYEAIFFNDEVSHLIKQLEPTHLDQYVDDMHCTFYFRPSISKIYNEIVGKKIKVTIVGYACDGNNSAFAIEISPEYQKYYARYFENGDIIPPHITVSIKEGAKPVDSQKLHFEQIKEPICIIGTFGYYMSGKDRKGYLSFEEQKY